MRTDLIVPLGHRAVDWNHRRDRRCWIESAEGRASVDCRDINHLPHVAHTHTRVHTLPLVQTAPHAAKIGLPEAHVPPLDVRHSRCASAPRIRERPRVFRRACQILSRNVPRKAQARTASKKSMIFLCQSRSASRVVYDIPIHYSIHHPAVCTIPAPPRPAPSAPASPAILRA